MIPAASLLAQFGLNEAAFQVLSVIAGVGGAFVGWFVSDPVARITHRLVSGKPIPGWTLPWIKLGSAIVLGLLVYFLIGFGGGPGGWGYGRGLGGGPGLGPGQGGKDTGVAVKDSADSKKTPPKDQGKSTDKNTVHKRVEVEILGGDRYPGGDRYYRLRATGKALTLKEIDAYFEENAGKLELHVIITDDSPAKGLGIREDLFRCASRHRIPSLETEPKRQGQ